MIKSIAQEVAPYLIGVNSIAPGAIRTPINKQAWETPEACADLMRLIPDKRIGEPDEIGRAAVWLASDVSELQARNNPVCGWWHDALPGL
jgi:glucose 1-dehydrogenase